MAATLFDKTLLTAFMVTVAMLTLLPSVSGMQCYQCNSVTDPHCEDIKKNITASQIYLHECRDPAKPEDKVPFCRKIVQTIVGGGDRRVIRKCGYERSTKPCYHHDNDVHAEVACQCFEEACNAATSTRTSLSILIVPGLLLLVAR